MHFLISAAGYEELITHTFVGDDPHLDTDAVFGVKETLVAPFEQSSNTQTQWVSRFNFVLAPQKEG